LTQVVDPAEGAGEEEEDVVANVGGSSECKKGLKLSTEFLGVGASLMW